MNHYIMPEKELNQREAVKLEILKLIDSGIHDKQEIYSKIETEMEIHRPTVRRIARELKFDLEKKLAILTTHGKHWL